MVWIAVFVFGVLLLGAAVVLVRTVRRKNIDIILAARAGRRPPACDGVRHVFFCIADHFEPFWHNRDRALALERVEHWRSVYPTLVDRFRDNGGRPPRHAFFYPQEEYEPECLDKLAEIQRRGFGEVEIHLHHDHDTSAGLRDKLLSFKEVLYNEHGLLHVDARTGQPTYAFIHGDWALNDSCGGRYCGVEDELVVLRDTGCYADFTYPSAPNPTQPPVVNSIYYANNKPGRRKSHFEGTPAVYGSNTEGDLLLFQGPLALNWRARRRGIFPAVENAGITGLNPATPDRVDLWIRTAVGVRGWPRWIFVKAYTHGTQENNSRALLSDAGAGLYEDLLRRYNDGERFILHFSTPWEMYRCVRVLEKADEAAIAEIESFEYRF